MRTEPVGLEKDVLLSCVNAQELLQNYSLSLVSPPQTVLQDTVTFYCFCVGHCVSEVRKLCDHPTWFSCSEDSIVNVFHKIKLNLLHYISVHLISFNSLLVYFAWWLFQVGLAIDTIFRPEFTLFQFKNSVIRNIIQHCNKTMCFYFE